VAAGKPTLLVVDDIPDTVEVLERNLTAAGFAVLTASSVQAAAAILEQKPVDVVVTDLKMPGQSGLDLIRHVRENFSDTATLMITGYPSLEGAVQAVKSGASSVQVSLSQRGEQLLLIVSDQGVGMTQETREKIFLPFFTTKEVGQGTGLGLAVVHGIVTSHGGAIEVSSTPGRGTQVSVQLPVYSGSSLPRS